MTSDKTYEDGLKNGRRDISIKMLHEDIKEIKDIVQGWPWHCEAKRKEVTDKVDKKVDGFYRWVLGIGGSLFLAMIVLILRTFTNHG